jgi:tail tube protein
MAIATGVNKQLKYKVEVTWGTVPAASGSQRLRRVTSDLSLRKQTYESNELLSTFQRQDYRHGVRSVEGSINGEISPGTYKDFMAAAVRRAFTTVTAISALSITIAGTGPTYTVTRAAGSWLTDGIKAGQVGRLTAGAFNAANLNKNLVVLAVTSATVLTVQPLNGVALVAEGPIASSTYTIPGKVTFAPASGHTDLSYSIEHWHSDVSLSEVFSGCKINRMSVNLPPTGMSTIGLDFLGKDIVKAGAEYFTSPTAETTTGILAAVNGVLVAQNTAIATITGMNFTLEGNMSVEPVIGSNVYADIAEGRILVSGQVTALFDSATLRDYFLDETEVSLVATLAASNVAAADFISFTLPRIKFGGADKDDGDKSLIQSLPFTALYNSSGGAGVGSEASTIYVQDSQA